MTGEIRIKFYRQASTRPVSVGGVSEFDLTRLPTGELGRAGLVQYVLATDDRAERYFLEVKSEVDLNTKADQAKVAKFILGAANRDRAQAARRFGGYSLMVLGVGSSEVVGVPPFEAKDLAKTVTRLVGSDGPSWDFDRVEVDGKDVIIITVDPPTGELWTCRADGAGVTDGAIFVRADGETRQATGDEIRVLISRATDVTPDVAVEVSVDGEVFAIHLNEDELTSWIDAEVALLRAQVSAPTGGCAMGVVYRLNSASEIRDRDEFLAQVASWEAASRAAPTRGVLEMAGRALPGVSLRLHNMGRTFLRSVRVDINFDAPIVAVDWAQEDRDEPVEFFPDRPNDWGRYGLADSLRMASFDNVVVRRRGVSEVLQQASTGEGALTLYLDALRPEEQFASDEDQVVLVMLDGAPPSQVTAHWRVTAEGVHDVFEGDFEMPVRRLDWRDPIRANLFGEDDEAES